MVRADSGVPSVGRGDASIRTTHGAELPPRRFIDGSFEEAPAGTACRATRADGVAADAERGGSGSAAGRLLDRAQHTEWLDADELIVSMLMNKLHALGWTCQRRSSAPALFRDPATGLPRVDGS